eukprot:jgi/Chlat1/4219/Chrsp27S04298
MAAGMDAEAGADGHKPAAETKPLSPTAAAQAAGNGKPDFVRVAICVVGIVGCLMIYGLLQERIMTQPFGEQGEMFKNSLFLVLCNRLVTCAIAFGTLLVRGRPIAPVAPVYKYALISLSNVAATTCQYEALKYLSFPMQTLGKCAKMIPVMIWGTIIMKKKYGGADYLVAVAVTIGCTVFVLAGETSSKAAVGMTALQSLLFGSLLMIGYLGFDGFTSTFQDMLFKGYQMDIFNQILYVTMCSSGISSLGLISSGQFLPSLSFVLRYPSSLFSILALSLSATFGQMFISYTIRTLGALVFATIMTTRQLLSILLSCIYFLHPLTLYQWAGTLMVFGALYWKTFSKKKGGHGHSAKPEIVAPPTETVEKQPLLPR